MTQETDTILMFTPDQERLFIELVMQTVTTLRLGRTKRTAKDAARFNVGEYVGGQADMSCDQEIHEMLHFTEVIDRNLCLRFDPAAMRQHLKNSSRFSIDLKWLFECFLNTLTEWHPNSNDHPFFSEGPIDVPPELTVLAEKLTKAGYMAVFGQHRQWTVKARASLGLLFWGFLTEWGEEARREGRNLLSALPANWRNQLRRDHIEWSSDDWRNFRNAISNHWYNGGWHDIPIRGKRAPMVRTSASVDLADLVFRIVHKTD